MVYSGSARAQTHVVDEVEGRGQDLNKRYKASFRTRVLEPARYPLSLPQVSHNRNRFSHCHLISDGFEPRSCR